jgi:hypothetical protein
LRVRPSTSRRGYGAAHQARRRMLGSAQELMEESENAGDRSWFSTDDGHSRVRARAIVRIEVEGKPEAGRGPVERRSSRESLPGLLRTGLLRLRGGGKSLLDRLPGSVRAASSFSAANWKRSARTVSSPSVAWAFQLIATTDWWNDLWRGCHTGSACSRSCSLTSLVGGQALIWSRLGRLGQTRVRRTGARRAPAWR